MTSADGYRVEVEPSAHGADWLHVWTDTRDERHVITSRSAPPGTARDEGWAREQVDRAERWAAAVGAAR